MPVCGADPKGYEERNGKQMKIRKAAISFLAKRC
jgi:hypothetical protein